MATSPMSRVCCETPAPPAAPLLVTGGALFAWAYLPRFARAARQARPAPRRHRPARRDRRPVGRRAVGDPDYAALRDGIALSLDGDKPALPLDGFFALHPAMPNFARLYKANQALVVHAAATGYRERSHFDGQDVLESGLAGPGRVDSGWMNRALQALPQGERVAHRAAAWRRAHRRRW